MSLYRNIKLSCTQFYIRNHLKILMNPYTPFHLHNLFFGNFLTVYFKLKALIQKNDVNINKDKYKKNPE